MTKITLFFSDWHFICNLMFISLSFSRTLLLKWMRILLILSSSWYSTPIRLYAISCYFLKRFGPTNEITHNRRIWYYWHFSSNLIFISQRFLRVLSVIELRILLIFHTDEAILEYRDILLRGLDFRPKGFLFPWQIYWDFDFLKN